MKIDSEQIRRLSSTFTSMARSQNGPVKHNYRSQLGQDFICAGAFERKRAGIFVEIGAHDGITLSNTYYLEKELGWDGLCVEPNADSFDLLRKNRLCCCVRAAAGALNADQVTFVKASGEMSSMSALADVFDQSRFDTLNQTFPGTTETVQVEMKRTQDLLDYACLSSIDYLSVDTDGNELDVLRGIDWDRTSITMITVEDLNRTGEIHNLLKSLGYVGAEMGWDCLFWKP